MMCKRLILLCVALGVQFTVVVYSETSFELRLDYFDNPSGKEHDGDCCESIFGGSCSSPCDPELTICIDEPNQQPCTSHHSFNSGEYGDMNSFPFGSPLRSNIANPYNAAFVTWPGTVSVRIHIVDKDHNNHDFMGDKTRTFAQTPSKNENEAHWKDFTFTYEFSTHTMTVTAKARVYCNRHWYGSDCTTLCFPRDHDDEGHYTCSDTGTKVCRENYYGELCKVHCVPEDSVNGHYFCDDNGGKVCHVGWTGASCTEDVDECVNSPCEPNGNCTNNEGSYTCECASEYTGRNCEEVKLFCDENPCSNHSVCNNTFGGYDCICADKWRGRHCDEEPYCTNNTCSNKSTCNNTDDGYVCMCDEGWIGKSCTEKVTPCTSSPCLNNGKCSVNGDNYKCECVGKWEGTECQSERKEVSTDRHTIRLAGELQTDQDNDYKKGIRIILEDLGFYNTVIEIDKTYDENEDITSVDTTVKSHDPNIVGVLKTIPDVIYSEHLPLPLASKSGVVESQVQLSKREPWVKEHWYAILLIVLALIAILAGVVIFLFVMKKRRTDKLQKSGFDQDQTVRPVDGSPSDAAVGFDNSLYYEIRQPEKIEGLPNGKY